MIKIKGSIILITGADGGIGTALLEECVKRKAGKIYATGLHIEKLNLLAAKYPQTVIAIVLDVMDSQSIENCVKQCRDTNILINNAGVELKSSFINSKASQAALFEMKVNYIGVVELVNNFVPELEHAADACIVNILSVGSLAVVKRLGTYCASKTATHMFTQTIREELRAKGILVIGVYPGYVNTEMVKEVDSIKAEPQEIAFNICNGIENGEQNIFPDNMSSAFAKANPIKINFLN